MRYYLGIDGGGSVTRAVLADELGIAVARCEAGSIHYRAVGYAAARANLRYIAAQLARPVRACFIGNAALAGPAPEGELRALTEGVLQAERLAMDSDLYIALEAMRVHGPCAVAIAGTGSMAAGRAGEGRPIVHTGGWGYLLGDEGSGFHIGWEALRAALQGYEGGGPATALTGEMCAFYGADAPEELLGLFYDPPMERQKIAAFAQRVLRCEDDAVARGIIRGCAAAFAATARALLRKLPPETPLGLWGGMFQHSEEYRRAFCRALEKQAELLPCPPEMGAVWAAMKLARGELS